MQLRRRPPNLPVAKPSEPCKQVDESDSAKRENFDAKQVVSTNEVISPSLSTLDSSFYPNRELVTLRKALAQIRNSAVLFYIYAICRSNGEPFYIGKGTAARIASHELEAKDLTNSNCKHQIIRAMKSNGYEVKYKLLEFYEDEEDALAEEKRLIKRYGRLDKGTGILANLSDGGEGIARDYRPEQWETDEDGLIILKEVEYPNSNDLEPLPYGYERRTLPLLSKWQDAGYTVVVHYVWQFMASLDIDMERELDRARVGTVSFRVFEGKRKVLGGSARFSAQEIRERTRLVPTILRALATLPMRRGRACCLLNIPFERYNKRQQAWLRNNSESLNRYAQILFAGLNDKPPVIASAVEVPTDSGRDDESVRLDHLVSEALRNNMLFPSFVKYLDDFAKMGIVFAHWTGIIKVDKPVLRNEPANETCFDWSASKRTAMEIREIWNTMFPSRQVIEGEAFVRTAILVGRQVLVQLHDRRMSASNSRSGLR